MLCVLTLVHKSPPYVQWVGFKNVISGRLLRGNCIFVHIAAQTVNNFCRVQVLQICEELGSCHGLVQIFADIVDSEANQPPF